MLRNEKTVSNKTMLLIKSYSIQISIFTTIYTVAPSMGPWQVLTCTSCLGAKVPSTDITKGVIVFSPSADDRVF